MLATLKRITEQLLNPESARDDDPEHGLRLATAVLALEVQRADFESAATEKARVRELLANRFRLDPAETEALVELATTRVNDVAHLTEFTQILKNRYDMHERERVLELLWEVSHADGRVDPHEEHLIRRVADLLYLPHATFIRLRHKVARRRH